MWWCLPSTTPTPHGNAHCAGCDSPLKTQGTSQSETVKVCAVMAWWLCWWKVAADTRHCCTVAFFQFPAVVITLISLVVTLLYWVGDMNTSLMRSTTTIVTAWYNLCTVSVWRIILLRNSSASLKVLLPALNTLHLTSYYKGLWGFVNNLFFPLWSSFNFF